MRIDAPPPRPSSARIDAIAVSMRAWVVGLLAWFCEVLDAVSPTLRALPGFEARLSQIKASIARDLRCAARMTRLYLIAAALARHDIPMCNRRPPPGHVNRRRVSRRAYYRAATSGAIRGLNHGSLRQRAIALRQLLERTATQIARVLCTMRRLHAAGAKIRPTIEAPRAIRCTPAARSPALVCFDSS
jgi:hypothetical protein